MVPLLCCRKFYHETICPSTLQFDCHVGNIQREYLVWVSNKVNLPAGFWTLSIQEFFQRKKLYNGQRVRADCPRHSPGFPAWHWEIRTTALAVLVQDGPRPSQPCTPLSNVSLHTPGAPGLCRTAVYTATDTQLLPETAGAQSTVSIKRNEDIRGLGSNRTFLSENNLAVKRSARTEPK